MATLLTVVSVVSVVNADDVIERRGGERTVEGAIIEIDEGGVWIRTEMGASKVVPWDRVRSVEAQSQRHQEQADALIGIAEELWRARSRVERGDCAMAEPIFAKHFERWRGTESETALVIAEGLLRCRLEQSTVDPDARAAAVVPVLEVARLRAAGVETVSYSTLAPVIDEKMLLCPALPPVWVGVSLEARVRLRDELAGYDGGGSDAIAAIAALYRWSVAIQKQADESADERLPRVNRHPGVELLRDCVIALAPNRNTRASARARLERRLTSGEVATSQQWVEAWMRYHIGASLLDERSEELRLRGLLNLAHLPARFSANQPYLAAIAMQRLIHNEDANNNPNSAETLRVELARRLSQYADLDFTMHIETIEHE